MSKAIQGSLRIVAVTRVDDTADLLQLGAIVPAVKTQIYHRIKKQLYEKAEALTEDDIKFETLYIPELEQS